MTKEERVEIQYRMSAIVEASKKVWSAQNELNSQLVSLNRYLNEVEQKQEKQNALSM
jgi:hypothetical protein